MYKYLRLPVPKSSIPNAEVETCPATSGSSTKAKSGLPRELGVIIPGAFFWYFFGRSKKVQSPAGKAIQQKHLLLQRKNIQYSFTKQRYSTAPPARRYN